MAVDGPTIATANTTLCAWLLCLPNVFNAVVKENRVMVIILAILNFDDIR